jgi:Tfp pilus assembly protein PilF
MNTKKNLILDETFALAILNHQKNNLLIAKKLYSEVLKIEPNYIGALLNLGTVFNQLGEYQ